MNKINLFQFHLRDMRTSLRLEGLVRQLIAVLATSVSACQLPPGPAPIGNTAAGWWGLACRHGVIPDFFQASARRPHQPPAYHCNAYAMHMQCIECYRLKLGCFGPF